MHNDEYAILKSFAALENTPGVPGLDLPGLDIVSLAKGYGCDATRIEELGKLEEAVTQAWARDVPTVLDIAISPQISPLI